MEFQEVIEKRRTIRLFKQEIKIGTGHLLVAKCVNSWMGDGNSWRSGRQVGMARAARQGPAGRRQLAASERIRPKTVNRAAGPPTK
jgi:hypothetical protein